jgi:hypothetical protein
MQFLHIVTALTFFENVRAVKKNNYLLNTSFKALAGKNFTF